MQASVVVDALIGRIYGDVSAATPWQGALGELRNAVGAQTLVLQMTVDRRPEQTYFLASGVRTAPAHIAEWERRSRDQQISLALAPGRILTCNDYLAHRPREGFVELIRRYDVARGMSAQVATHDGAEYSLHALRPGRDQPFGEDEEALFARLVPHLSRAIALRAELAAARDQASLSAAALDHIGIGMLCVDARARVTAINARAGIALPYVGLRIRDGRLGADDRQLATRLNAALAAALAPNAADGLAIAITLDQGASALVRASPRTEPTIGRPMPAATMVIVTEPVLDARAVETLRNLFGLTSTEATVALHLAMGRNAREIQAAMAIRYTTLRTHMSQLFVKLDCSRQAELVHRLTSLLPVLH